MYPALRIAEIVSVVFRFLEKKDLRHCVAVCGGWFHSAIEVIWAKAGFTSELLKVFVLTGLLVKNKELIWSFTRSPSQKEWDHLFLYTSQVQHLTLGGRETINLSYKAQQILLSALHSTKRPLFPRTRIFSCTIKRKADLWFVATTMTRLPQMTTADISWDAKFVRVGLNELRTLGELQSATLFHLGHGLARYPNAAKDKIWADLGWAIPVCSSLETFLVSVSSMPMSSDVFKMLGALPRLKRLEGSFQLDSSFIPSSTRPTFPELEILRLVSPASSARLLLGSWFPPPKLEVLEVNLVYGTAARDIVDGLVSVPESPIRTLEFEVFNGLHYSRFSRLTQLHNLRSLTIYGHYQITMSDLELETLVSGLRELQEFKLFTVQIQQLGTHIVTCTQLTLKAIFYLVHSCPNLSKITLEFDATQIPDSKPRFRYAGSGNMKDDPKQWPSSSSSSTTFVLNPRLSELGNSKEVAEWLLWCCQRYERVQIETPRTRDPAESRRVQAWAVVGEMCRPR